MNPKWSRFIQCYVLPDYLGRTPECPRLPKNTPKLNEHYRYIHFITESNTDLTVCSKS